MLNTKQTIAIIGAGGIRGSAIAGCMAGGNYRLLLFDSNPEQLDSLKEKILRFQLNADLELMNCPHESSWEADLIILAVPHEAEKALADKIREVATQKIVVSIANPVDENFNSLTTDPDASAGLYHTAILYPIRKDLSKILKRLIDEGYPVDGASDHGVSETIYLTDPDGNGVELYRDHPREAWEYTENSSVKMVTRPLDLEDLLSELD